MGRDKARLASFAIGQVPPPPLPVCQDDVYFEVCLCLCSSISMLGYSRVPPHAFYSCLVCAALAWRAAAGTEPETQPGLIRRPNRTLGGHWTMGLARLAPAGLFSSALAPGVMRGVWGGCLIMLCESLPRLPLSLSLSWLCLRFSS